MWYLQRINYPEECYEVSPGETTIGRNPVCSITLVHLAVSRSHCKVIVSDDDARVYVQDLSSANGVYVKDERIVPNVPTEVAEGCTIGIGLPEGCEYPDLEDKDYFCFKLIKKFKAASQHIEIIDLTVDVKQEFDLHQPIEIIDDEDESFAFYESIDPLADEIAMIFGEKERVSEKNVSGSTINVTESPSQIHRSKLNIVNNIKTPIPPSIDKISSKKSTNLKRLCETWTPKSDKVTKNAASLKDKSNVKKSTSENTKTNKITKRVSDPQITKSSKDAPSGQIKSKASENHATYKIIKRVSEPQMTKHSKDATSDQTKSKPSENHATYKIIKRVSEPQMTKHSKDATSGQTKSKPSENDASHKINKRSSEPMKSKTLDTSKTRTSVQNKSKPKESSKPSVSNDSSVSRKLVRQTRSSKLKEIAEKELALKNSKQSHEGPKAKIPLAAKITNNTRGSMLLENFMSSPTTNEKRKPTSNSFNNVVTLLERLVLSRILYWDPRWLEVKDVVTREPPIYSNADSLEKMTNQFSDYECYKRILGNFVCFEIWNTFCAASISASVKKTIQYRLLQPIQANSIDDITVIRVGPAVIDRSQIIPKYGDMLIMKYGDSQSCIVIVKNTLSQVKSKGIFILDLYIRANSVLSNIQIQAKIQLLPMTNISYELASLYTIYKLKDTKLQDMVVSPYVSYYKILDCPVVNKCKETLDRHQLKAFQHCLGASKVNECSIQIIQGPPGTGKSTILSYLALEIASQHEKKKVLLCSTSNSGADHLYEIVSEIQKKFYSNKIINIRRAGRGEQQFQTLDENLQYDETSIIDADIAVSTLWWCTKLEILKNKVHVCLIDDASFASEIESLSPIALNIPFVVLAGDVRQPSLSLTTKHSKNMGFNSSFYSRITRLAFQRKTNTPLLLMTQHRMRPVIFQWLNRSRYHSKVECGKATFDCVISAYQVLIMPKGANNASVEDQITALCVGRLAWAIGQYLAKRNKNVPITVLTHSTKQKGSICNFMSSLDIGSKKQISVHTFDEFQGRESNVVIVAPLKNPTTRDITAFFNIGLTRAIESLFICCYDEIKNTNDYWKDLLEDASNRRLVSYIPSRFASIPTNADILNDEKFIEEL